MRKEDNESSASQLGNAELLRLLELSTDAILVRDSSDRTIFWSPGATVTYGYASQEALGRNPDELLKTVFPQPLEQIRAALHRTGHWNGELVHTRKDGSRVITNSRWVVDSPLGRPAYILETNTDITERKHLEEQLRQGEERFKTLANAMPQLAWIANPDGYIHWYNRRWYEYTGTTPEQMEGWGWQSVHDPRELPKVMELWQASIATGGPFDMVFPLRGSDGVFRPFLTRIVPLKDQQGRVLQWFGTNTDVTEEKRAEDALRESEVRYRSFVEASAQVIWTTNARGEVKMDIPAWQAYTGQTSEQARGFGWMDAIHPDDREPVAAAWAKAYESSGIYEVEYRLRVHDGTWRNILARGVPVFDEDNQVREYVGTCIDITARKKAEDDLKTSNQELEQFAYVASHDLQEPLRTIVGFLNLLEARYKPQLDDQAQQYIAYAVDGGRRMSQLINDLLTYSRIERNRDTVLQPTRSGEALTNALANLGATLRQTVAKVTYDALPTVTSELTQLTQVFQNLIANAIKFRDPERPCRIHVSAARKGEFWEFSIEDNGIGIDRPYHDLIFKIFQRLHTQKKYKGTGIGLTICKKIIDRHGGRIWLDSIPGKGTTFFFTVRGT